MVLPVVAAGARAAASKARRAALIKARRALRNVKGKTKFTGEKPSVFLYGGAAIIALFKDLLDLVGVGSFPAIGTVVTICFNILIFLLLMLFDNFSGGNVGNRKFTRGFIIIVLTLVEGLGFGLNFLPLETLTVVVLYIMARSAWKKAEKEANEKNKYTMRNQSRGEIERVNRNMEEFAAGMERMEGGARYEGGRQRGAANDQQYHVRAVANVERTREYQGARVEAPANEEQHRAEEVAALSQMQEMESGRETNASIPPEVSTAEVNRSARQQLKSPTETWIRDRYEKPYRDEQAKKFLGQRARGVDRVDLREKVRTVNLESRTGIQNTAQAFDSGALDIKNLAAKNNAVVVHAIPLDGWAMKNTSENNRMVAADSMSAKEKVTTIIEKRPDLSVSIIGADTTVPNQEMFYPFGFVVDGKLIAAYENDAGAYADGDARRRKEQYSGTLQTNPVEQFAQMAHSPTLNSNYGHNESIVHQPELKAVLIDTNTILKHEAGGGSGYIGDEVTETFAPEKEAEILARYGESIVSSGKGVPTSGPYAGKEILRIKRKRTGVQKALEFAETNYPELPVYLRKSDGIYSLSGEKVTAEQIYSTQKRSNVRKVA